MTNLQQTVEHRAAGTGPLQLLYAGARLTVAPPASAPFRVDAQVEEEDTHLLLSAEPLAQIADDSLDRLAREAECFRPHALGSVLARHDGDPLRLLAVIHDVDREPTWREEWVLTAHEQVWRTVASLGLRSLALPLLGTRHGNMHGPRALHLLLRALAHRSGGHRTPRVWVQVPADECQDVYSMMLARRLG